MHRRNGRTLPCAVMVAAVVLPVGAAEAAEPVLPDAGSVIAVVGDPLAAPLPAPTAVTAPVATDAASCAGVRARPSRLAPATARAALLCAINRARARHGLPGMGADRRLRRAARGQARDMVRRRYFAHQRPGGPSLGQRLSAAGYHGRAAGEAIAWGCGSSASAGSTVRAWMHSPPHRAILLSGVYRRAGVGVAGHAPASCAPGATWVLDAGT